LPTARPRFVPYPSLDKAAASRRRREYRRRLRRFLYAGCDAVMLEGVVERKSWLHATLDDLMLLVWKAPDEPTARALAERDLDALHVHLNEYEHLDDDGMVKLCSVAAEIDDDLDDSANREWPLSARNTLIHEVEDAVETDIATPGEIACTAPSAATASSTS
jgi:adenylate cyclase